MVNAPLDTALGSVSKVRILRLLCEQERIFTARELSRLSGTTLPAILKSLADLEALGLLIKDRVGAQYQCRGNPQNKLYRLLQPVFQEEARLKAEFFEAMKAALTKPQPVAAWVFGSVAQNRERAGSDVDLFVLTEKSEDRLRYEDVLLECIPKWQSQFGHRVNPMYMTADRAELQLKGGNPLLKNAIADARMIVGEIPQALYRAESDDTQDQKPPH
jgi:predicted nucleotidyltransferase